MKRFLSLPFVALAILVIGCGPDDEFLYNHYGAPEGKGSLIIRSYARIVEIDRAGFSIDPAGHELSSGQDVAFDLQPHSSGHWVVLTQENGSNATIVSVCIVEGVVTEVTVRDGEDGAFDLEILNRDGSPFLTECPPPEPHPEVDVSGRWRLKLLPLDMESDLSLTVSASDSGGWILSGNAAHANMANAPEGSVSGSLDGRNILFRASNSYGVEFEFRGTVNAAGTSMSGTFTPANPEEDQWRADRP